MPTPHLRNRKQQRSGKNGTQNGVKSQKQVGWEDQHQIHYPDNEQTLTKKLILAEEEEEQRCEDSNNNNNSISDNITSEEDEYSDMSMMDSGAKSRTSAPTHDEEERIILEAHEVETSIGRSAKDQFADALLRLQADLDRTNGRLSAIETKVDELTRGNNNTQQVRIEANKKAKRSKGSFFNRDNMTTLFYIGWPVLVFFAMRTLEKRRSSRQLTSN